jgi:DNA-binding IclR family transcriptional regulator
VKPLSPQETYRVGLLVQAIDDAGPEGLTFAELGARTQFGAVELRRGLGLAVERGYVRRDGERYFATG